MGPKQRKAAKKMRELGCLCPFGIGFREKHQDNFYLSKTVLIMHFLLRREKKKEKTHTSPPNAAKEDDINDLVMMQHAFSLVELGLF